MLARMWVALIAGAGGALLAILAMLIVQRWPEQLRPCKPGWAGLQCRLPIRETCRRWRRRQAQLQRARAEDRPLKTHPGKTPGDPWGKKNPRDLPAAGV